MMPPLMVRLHVARLGGARRFRLWLPLFLIWILVLPFAVVTLPVMALVLALLGRHPLRMFGALWSMLCALPGSHLEVNGPRASVFLHVY
jgi:hypothetical protein